MKSDENVEGALEDGGVVASKSKQGEAQAADMRRQQMICLPVSRRGLRTMEATR